MKKQAIMSIINQYPV